MLNRKNVIGCLCFALLIGPGRSSAQQKNTQVNLPTSKTLALPLPGSPERLNSFPSVMAVSQDQRYLAILNNGFGTKESEFRQSIAIVDTSTNTIADFPDVRMEQDAKQSFFMGLAFSSDGSKLYASVGSLSDPYGLKGGPGNGISVYGFAAGKIEAQRFLPISAPAVPQGKKSVAEENEKAKGANEHDSLIPYPAGIAVVASDKGDMLLVADNLSDDAVLMDASNGAIIHRYDFSRHGVIPAEYPYAAAASSDGKTGYVSLWNSSEVAEIDLRNGGIRRFIKLKEPAHANSPGSHPTAMLLSPNGRWLYVTLSNRDAVAVINTRNGRVKRTVSVKLHGQKYDGAYPNALAQSSDGNRLFVANAGSDAVAVLRASQRNGRIKVMGFIPTEWYPSALAVSEGRLRIASAKGQGTGPNNFAPPASWHGNNRAFTYIPSLLHGSLASIPLDGIDARLSTWTQDVLRSNQMRGAIGGISFQTGRNPIRHVIYIIKENRSYDQVLGDVGAGNSDPALTMYGEEITPNEHALARQFGLLDNFYTSGEVSGDGHVWSTAAISSDYTEKTWQIGYRSYERTYDYEGKVGGGYPLEEGIADVDEPGTGYLWGNLARHKKSYRHYGEFISTSWCNASPDEQSPLMGTPLPPGESCTRREIQKGEALPPNVGEPHGSPSPWAWKVPLVAKNTPTMPELRGHFDENFPDFNLLYPDQLRVDEFLNEFTAFVAIRSKKKRDRMPQFILLRLPDDHTAGTRPGYPTPSASVADNDLALGRVVEAVSHTSYWDDTAIFVLEDDSQNGPDHVDAHRSTAFVISKYSPAGSTPGQPFVESSFYTTVNMIHTMESLLKVPPMNNNDARSALMAPMFSGPAKQPPFTADRRNQQNGLIYSMNTPRSPRAKESAAMDFSHADAADAAQLNRILWLDRMGARPYPATQHNVFH